MKSFAIVSSENNNITLSNGNETNSKKISQGYQMLGTYLTISNSGNVTNFCLHTKPGRKQHTRYRHLEMSRRSYSYSIKTGLGNPVCIRYTVGVSYVISIHSIFPDFRLRIRLNLVQAHYKLYCSISEDSCWATHPKRSFQNFHLSWLKYISPCHKSVTGRLRIYSFF